MCVCMYSLFGVLSFVVIVVDVVVVWWLLPFVHFRPWKLYRSSPFACYFPGLQP